MRGEALERRWGATDALTLVRNGAPYGKVPLNCLAPFGHFWPISPVFRIAVVEALAVPGGPVQV